jgi:hypothetical protein
MSPLLIRHQEVIESASILLWKKPRRCSGHKKLFGRAVLVASSPNQPARRSSKSRLDRKFQAIFIQHKPFFATGTRNACLSTMKRVGHFASIIGQCYSNPGPSSSTERTRGTFQQFNLTTSVSTVPQHPRHVTMRKRVSEYPLFKLTDSYR